MFAAGHIWNKLHFHSDKLQQKKKITGAIQHQNPVILHETTRDT